MSERPSGGRNHLHGGRRLWVAQGFGSGRLPGAPGTFGSLIGLLWLAALLIAGDPWVFAVGGALGVAVAVWFCGEAEQLLNQHDPPSVVLDEIVAIPLCFVTVLAVQTVREGFPNLVEFLQSSPWWLVPAGFLVFRFFDVVKPWPVRQVQRFPGGWGIVVDDVLAAVWVNVVSLLAVA